MHDRELLPVAFAVTAVGLVEVLVRVITLTRIDGWVPKRYGVAFWAFANAPVGRPERFGAWLQRNILPVLGPGPGRSDFLVSASGTRHSFGRTRMSDLSPGKLNEA